MDYHFNAVCVFSFLETPESNQALLKTNRLLQDWGITIMQLDRVSECDLIIVIGGDGSILHQARFAHQYQIPILGINLGRIGFLADVELSDDDVLQAILLGHYLEDKRRVLRCRIGPEEYIAINEIAFSKQESFHAMHYEVFVDDHFLYNQLSDGLIIATPTGSTAYALSAGGQIIHPSVGAITLVPICPSNISSRPIILSDKSKIQVVLDPLKDRSVSINCDGVSVSNPASARHFTIEVDSNPVTFIHPRHYDYYRTLQHKLNWETTPLANSPRAEEK